MIGFLINQTMPFHLVERWYDDALWVGRGRGDAPADPFGPAGGRFLGFCCLQSIRSNGYYDLRWFKGLCEIMLLPFLPYPTQVAARRNLHTREHSLLLPSLATFSPKKDLWDYRPT